jgi:hypothetical protein
MFIVVFFGFSPYRSCGLVICPEISDGIGLNKQCYANKQLHHAVDSRANNLFPGILDWYNLKL